MNRVLKFVKNVERKRFDSRILHSLFWLKVFCFIRTSKAKSVHAERKAKGLISALRHRFLHFFSSKRFSKTKKSLKDRELSSIISFVKTLRADRYIYSFSIVSLPI